ncbi:uncharacterized protein LOC129144950 [Talpa occidentalis]|uniref:uncharacterized protein LOC129144950 n=1 Tax=Talpa occidentalis TaxID=50954 RepID=UPI0023F796E2|nr:uncharacterized protein LOC129144950 [Talpa occidentalis]XP_054545943.1 uncharacterized protein LOC129144950 [Talpa occidentalis]
MGNSMFKGQLVISLEALLKEFGVPLSRKILKRFVETLSITSKWFLEQDQVDSDKWNKVKGDIVLHQQLYGLESLPGTTLTVWGVVGDALNAGGTAAVQLATEAVRTAKQTEEEDRSSIMSSTLVSPPSSTQKIPTAPPLDYSTDESGGGEEQDEKGLGCYKPRKRKRRWKTPGEPPPAPPPRTLDRVDLPLMERLCSMMERVLVSQAPNYAYPVVEGTDPQGVLTRVHVSIDTFSGFLFASPNCGEKTSDVCSHLLQAFAVMGRPRVIKTDNGPGYTSKAFASFCAVHRIVHKTGIPYNPQGQGIVERAHGSLKTMLLKQTGGEHSPRDRLTTALFTLNFLTLDAQGWSAADRHWSPDPRQVTMLQVRWKDQVNNEWQPPAPVLIQLPGSICLFSQDAESPQWVPARLVRFVDVPDPANLDDTSVPDVSTMGDCASAVFFAPH